MTVRPEHQEFAACSAGSIVKAFDQMLAEMDMPPDLSEQEAEDFYNEVYEMVLNDIAPQEQKL